MQLALQHWLLHIYDPFMVFHWLSKDLHEAQSHLASQILALWSRTLRNDNLDEVADSEGRRLSWLSRDHIFGASSEAVRALMEATGDPITHIDLAFRYASIFLRHQNYVLKLGPGLQPDDDLLWPLAVMCALPASVPKRLQCLEYLGAMIR